MGIYLSQDPIGLAGNNPTLYGYVFNTGLEVDVFGLARDCYTPQGANQKIRRGQGPREITRIYAPEASVPGSQWHAHSHNNGALNIDGSIHDAHRGDPGFSRNTLNWLREHGWNI